MKIITRFKSIVLTNINDNRALFVRIIVGLIFLSEGIQKYLFPELVGTGRFIKIGFSHPAFWAYFTGTFEIFCGFLILLGLFIRLATIPLIIVMLTAFITTKWPILVDKGFWVMMHDYRTDFALTILLIYLLIYGSGRWSIDAGINKSFKT